MFSYLGGEQGKGKLESALKAPTQTWGGVYLSRTIFDKAAVLFRSVVKNHPLVDGNKRLGLTCTTTFLMKNRYLFLPPRDEAIEFAVRIAEGSPTPSEIASWLRRKAVPFWKVQSMNNAELTAYAPHLHLHIAYIRKEVRRLERDINRLTGVT